MRVTEAVNVINRMVFRPEWDIQSRPSAKPGHVEIVTRITTQDTRKEYAPNYPKVFVATGIDVMDVADLETKDDIYFRFLTQIVPRINAHEDREFLRDPDTLEAPFHPHKFGGIMEWLERSAAEDPAVFVAATLGI